MIGGRAFVTFGVGPHARFLEIARPSFRAFAKRHGYDYYEPSRIDPVRPAPWYKVKAIIGLIGAGYREVLFAGADLVIVDGRRDVAEDVPGDAWQALVQHHTGDGMVPNTDFWLCRREMLPWLLKCWEMNEYLHHGWWEQAALLRLMGYSLQPCAKYEESDLANRTYFLDPGWNVHVWDAQRVGHARAQHATMWPDRAQIMQMWARQAEEWINE